MSALKKKLERFGIALISIMLVAFLTQCSSESGGEDPTDDGIGQGTDDDAGSGNSDDGSTGDMDDEVSFTSFINPSDPQLLSAEYEDGNMVILSGEKDEEGIPIAIEQVQVKEASGEQVTLYLDGDQRLDQVVFPDGSLFDFEWSSDVNATLTALSPDRQAQVNVEIELASGKTSFQSISNVEISRASNIEIHRSLLPENENFNHSAAGKPDQVVQLSITQCGEFVDPQVRPYAEIINNQGDLIRTLNPKRTGKGVYEITAPVPEPVDVANPEVCRKLAEKVEGYCQNLEGISSGGVCASLQLGIIKLPASINEATKQALLDNCAKLIDEYLPLTCLLLLEDDRPLADVICEADTRDFNIPDGSFIYAVVPTEPIDKASQSEVINGPTNIPDLLIDLGGDTLIQDFVISPSAPVAGQSYRATVSLGCVEIGTVIELNIVGTDGFSDTATYTETEEVPFGEYFITVEGAEQGVQDTLTVTVTLPDGTVLTRTASLVFG